MTDMEWDIECINLQRRLSIVDWRCEMDLLISSMSMALLEYVVETAGVKGRWVPEWLEKCQQEYVERQVLQR